MCKKKIPLFMALTITLIIIFPLMSAMAASNQTDLEAAISGAAGPLSINLDTDISLNSTLTIPAGKDITLTGSSNLIGANGNATITVNGKLTLDGITVTHVSGEIGSGVIIGGGGELILQSGTISGNTVSATGGGVANMNGASFTMNGGTITGNTATAANSNGGGVYNNSGASSSFIMNGGTITGNTAANGGGVFNNQGVFIMFDGAAIIGNTTTKDAGGVYNSNSTFTMNGGMISGNTAAATGGGVRNNGAAAVFTMNGGEISGNISAGDAGGGVMNMSSANFILSGGKISGNTSSMVSGGGVNNQASTFLMLGGEISENTGTSGGGVLNWSGGSFTMEGGEISGNMTTAAQGRGGGILNFGPAVFTMKGGTITGHTTASNGGGIYSIGTGAVVTIEGGTISGNTASVDGGGVWTDDLWSLTVGVNAVFSSNSASAAYNRNPADDALYAAQIHGTQWTSPFIQGYNNFDINYNFGNPITFNVTYDGNGSTGGSVPTDANQYNPNDTVTVLGEGSLVKTNYTFLGWSTNKTAASAQYQAGDTFTITGDTTLYAIWQGPLITYTVTYDGNGNTGGSVPTDTNQYNPNDTVTVLGKGSLVKTNYTFLGWSTDKTAASAQYQPGDTFTITGNTTLYAVWQGPLNTYTVTYDGNGNTGGSVPTDTNQYNPNDTVTVLGQGSLVKTNYTFLGWSTDKTAASAQYQPGDTFTITGSTTLYAIWQGSSITYTVTYVGNSNTGGSVPTDAHQYNPNDTVTVLGQGSLVKTNYTFLGWSTDKTAASAQYQAGDTFTITGNTTLYAIWQVASTTTPQSGDSGPLLYVLYFAASLSLFTMIVSFKRKSNVK